MDSKGGQLAILGAVLAIVIYFIWKSQSTTAGTINPTTGQPYNANLTTAGAIASTATPLGNLLASLFGGGAGTVAATTNAAGQQVGVETGSTNSSALATNNQGLTAQQQYSVLTANANLGGTTPTGGVIGTSEAPVGATLDESPSLAGLTGTGAVSLGSDLPTNTDLYPATADPSAFSPSLTDASSIDTSSLSTDSVDATAVLSFGD